MSTYRQLSIEEKTVSSVAVKSKEKSEQFTKCDIIKLWWLTLEKPKLNWPDKCISLAFKYLVGDDETAEGDESDESDGNVFSHKTNVKCMQNATSRQRKRMLKVPCCANQQHKGVSNQKWLFWKPLKINKSKWPTNITSHANALTQLIVHSNWSRAKRKIVERSEPSAVCAFGSLRSPIFFYALNRP